MTGEIKIVELKTLDTAIANVFTKMHCHLMLLIRLAPLLWLSNVSNSVNNIQVQNTKYLINDELVVHFLILHIKIRELQSSLL